jgi:acyl-CoA reductase-like NAD-dependent aldehyde dehydrogenase
MRRESRLGPLVNATQYAKVTQYVQQAKQQVGWPASA